MFKETTQRCDRAMSSELCGGAIDQDSDIDNVSVFLRYSRSTDIKRIVALAVDEGAHSEYAFDYYCEKIQKDGDKLVMIHVPEEQSFFKGAEEKVRQMKMQATKMDALEKKYMDRHLLPPIDRVFRIGVGRKPGPVIVRVSREERADLLIVGTRGFCPAKQLILGSISKYVLCNSSIPVLLCRRDEGEDVLQGPTSPSSDRGSSPSSSSTLPPIPPTIPSPRATVTFSSSPPPANHNPPVPSSSSPPDNRGQSSVGGATQRSRCEELEGDDIRGSCSDTTSERATATASNDVL